MEKRKIAMLVSNPCNPDYRVVKQAESLAAVGYEVRIFCVWRRGIGLPTYETINGVTYVRREWSPLKILRQYFLGEREYPQIPRLFRDKHKGLTKSGKK
jgi:hypothetical protein